MSGEFSEGGSEIFRHQAPEDDELVISHGDEALIEAVSAHIERHLGPVERVFHELISPHVHVDVHWVAPSAARPWHVLVTSGMAERPMQTPEGAEEWAHAELMIALPARWPVGGEDFHDEENFWPVRWLKMIARLPHEYGTWVGFGHTIPNGDPPAPFAPGTSLSGMILLAPARYPEEFFQLEVSPGRTVSFWSLVPLHADEMELKLKKGTEALLELLDAAGVTDLINPARPSVAPRRRRWRFW